MNGKIGQPAKYEFAAEMTDAVANAYAQRKDAPKLATMMREVAAGCDLKKEGAR